MTFPQFSVIVLASLRNCCSAISRQLSARDQNTKGFTLIELIVAISIVVILSTIGIASYAKVQENARDTRRQQDLNTIMNGVVFYMQANDNDLPTTTEGPVRTQISSLSPNYINVMPEDPTCDTDEPLDEDRPCYYYEVIDIATNLFGIAAKMDNLSNANITACSSAATALGGSLTLANGYNYCITP